MKINKTKMKIKFKWLKSKNYKKQIKKRIKKESQILKNLFKGKTLLVPSYHRLLISNYKIMNNNFFFWKVS